MSNTRYWKCQLIGWSAYTAAHFLIFGALLQNLKAALQHAVLGAFGLFLTQTFRSFIKRHNWTNLPLSELVWRVLAACVALALVWQGFTIVVIISMSPSIPAWLFQPGIFLGNLFTWAVALLVWSLIYFGYHYVARYESAEIERWRLESAVKDAELKALKSQMNPHFIFNCLNSIRALIVEDPERGQTVVTQLANILRYSLQAGNAETVRLEEELQIVNDYLALEKTRLEDRLEITMQIDPTSGGALLPPMALQTLVENAIKYGIATQPNGGRIYLVSRVRDGMLQIQITNTGQLRRSSNSNGFGLVNTTERLKLLFGDAASLSLKQSSPDDVTAYLRIPFEDRRNPRS